MTRDDLVKFLRSYKLAVEASVAHGGGHRRFPDGDELERLRQVYFVPYPDGRERLLWPGITHVRVRPTWVRFSDFTVEPPRIVELTAADLG